MIYHFEYNNINHSYDTSIGWIEKEDKYGVFFKYFPVYYDLTGVFNQIPETVRTHVLKSLVHSYIYGHDAGEQEKLSQIRRVLGVNFN